MQLLHAAAWIFGLHMRRTVKIYIPGSAKLSFSPYTYGLLTSLAALLVRAHMVVALVIFDLFDGDCTAGARVAGAQRKAALVHLADTPFTLYVPSFVDGNVAAWTPDGIAVRGLRENR